MPNRVSAAPWPPAPAPLASCLHGSPLPTGPARLQRSQAVCEKRSTKWEHRGLLNPPRLSQYHVCLLPPLLAGGHKSAIPFPPSGARLGSRQGGHRGLFLSGPSVCHSPFLPHSSGRRWPSDSRGGVAGAGCRLASGCLALLRLRMS